MAWHPPLVDSTHIQCALLVVRVLQGANAWLSSVYLLMQVPLILWLSVVMVIFGVSYSNLQGLQGPLASLVRVDTVQLNWQDFDVPLLQLPLRCSHTASSKCLPFDLNVALGLVHPNRHMHLLLIT